MGRGGGGTGFQKGGGPVNYLALNMSDLRTHTQRFPPCLWRLEVPRTHPSLKHPWIHPSKEKTSQFLMKFMWKCQCSTAGSYLAVNWRCTTATFPGGTSTAIPGSMALLGGTKSTFSTRNWPRSLLRNRHFINVWLCALSFLKWKKQWQL